MKEPIWKNCTEEDVWKFVGWHLAKNGVETILVRLASYIHFKARECLDQAVLVAQKRPFNRRKVKEWCASEGAPQAYNELIKKLAD